MLLTFMHPTPRMPALRHFPLRQHMLRWIITAVGLVSTMHCVGTTWAQQQAEPKLDIATFKDTILVSLAEGGLGPDHPATRFNRSILKTHARYHEAILAKHRLQLAEWEAQYEKTMSRILETESPENAASIPMSVDTVEHLLRECLIELQRIEWESATIPVQDATAARTERETRIQMVALKKAQEALDGIRQRLDLATNAFQNSEAQFKQGLLSENELHNHRMRLATIESELSQKELDVVAIQEQTKNLQSSEQEQVAERTATLERRREVLLKQLDQLKAARLRARKTEMLLKQLDLQQTAGESIQQEIARQQLLVTEVRTLLNLLDGEKAPEPEPKSAPKP